MTTIAPAAAAVERMRMKTDREVIEDALALIEADGGWTQGAYCRDADGTEVHPADDSPGNWVRTRTEHVGAGGYRVRTEPGAAPCSFCLLGALRTAADYWHGGQRHAAYEQVYRLECLLLRLANSAGAPAWPSVNAYNDDARTTKADVVLMLMRAAAHLDAHEHEQPRAESTSPTRHRPTVRRRVARASAHHRQVHPAIGGVVRVCLACPTGDSEPSLILYDWLRGA